jgi:hypothetical protein
MRKLEYLIRAVWIVGYIAAFLLFSGAIWVKGHALSSDLSSEGGLVAVASVMVTLFWGGKWHKWFA